MTAMTRMKIRVTPDPRPFGPAPLRHYMPQRNAGV